MPATLRAHDAVALGNAAQTLHPVAGQGFNLGLRDAWELARIVLDTPREELGGDAMLRRYSRGRRTDRMAGIAFTHGLTRVSAMIFRCCAGLAGWRSLCSTPFRLRKKRSRARCCSASAENRAAIRGRRIQKACHSSRGVREKVAVASRTTYLGTL
jgi:hypothetical protein